jgi:hypothetical protein
MGNGINLPCTTNTLPRDYVTYLCNPGLKTRGGVVPLQMYMGAHKNGKKSAEFLDALFRANLADLDDRSWTPASCVPDSELTIMKKGQGNDVYYVRLWDWIWDNQEQLGSSNSQVLRDVYDKYFVKKLADPNPLVGMVKDAYFGNECIGFVSNYLRHIKAWEKYNGVDNHHWDIHFNEKVQDLDDVRPLDLLEWKTDGHVALINKSYGMLGGQLRVQISQCSGFENGLKGPMTNLAFLSPVNADDSESDAQHRVFKISGVTPVGGYLQIRRMRGLNYATPAHHAAYDVPMD